jgi:hypothetical protein
MIQFTTATPTFDPSDDPSRVRLLSGAPRQSPVPRRWYRPYNKCTSTRPSHDFSFASYLRCPNCDLWTGEPECLGADLFGNFWRIPTFQLAIDFYSCFVLWLGVGRQGPLWIHHPLSKHSIRDWDIHRIGVAHEVDKNGGRWEGAARVHSNLDTDRGVMYSEVRRHCPQREPDRPRPRTMRILQTSFSACGNVRLGRRRGPRSLLYWYWYATPARIVQSYRAITRHR